METFSANELAEKIQRVGKTLGYDVKINHIENPRKEAEEHYYNPKHTGLLELGLEPHYMNEEMLVEMLDKVKRHSNQIHRHKIFRNTKWA